MADGLLDRAAVAAAVRRCAADVAAFAMMLADVCGALDGEANGG